MAKSLTAPRYIFKIHTDRLKKKRWKLELTLDDAKHNEEMIALNDSQMLRWIDEINGVENVEERVREIRRQIKHARKQPPSTSIKRTCKALYAELDSLLFKPDYMHLVIDHDKDLYRACKGFEINGVRYRRLVGTNGGVKQSTIVFVNEKLVDELRRRIDNGRSHDVLQIPSKFEAYRALTCSGSTPVSMPNGILVVPDCETTFRENVLMLTDEAEGEPVLQYIEDYEIVLDESDGYGLMCPALAERWSNELGLNYVMSACNTRMAFEKGMAFTFDFHEFAEKVAGNYIVKDAWGHEVDVRNVELILTTSMLKLWKCYDSIEHYLACCEENHYTFGVPKVAPKVLDSWRRLNYQFIQSFYLTDEQIDELIAPTMNEIHDVLVGDYRSALLFLRGKNITEDNALDCESDFIRALMIDKRMFDDPYVKRKLYNSIKSRIEEAKIGVIGVHGNYSLVCGDPYALCQSIFGLEVTGLLKAHEIYNQYWVDAGASSVACFRAPMSNHNNIKKMNVVATDEMRHWYQYISTCTLFNAWDSTAQALNGFDKDGDLVFLTDNPVLINNIRDLPTIFCIQRTGKKIDPSEEDLIASNILGFGDDIGKVTNRVTSMFDVMSMYDQDSEEYRTLEYRIMCGQLYQQNAIDKIKGIIAKPMPRSWFDKHAIPRPDANMTEEEVKSAGLYRRIVSDRKPYFMRYIYPDLMKEYKNYVQQANAKCFIRYRMTLDDLIAMDEESMTHEQLEFRDYVVNHYPVSMNNCVMNRICKKFENEFDGILSRFRSTIDFDCRFLRAKCGYTSTQFYKVKSIYEDYKKWASAHAASRAVLNLDKDEMRMEWRIAVSAFVRDCLDACCNIDRLINIMIDLFYKSDSGKQFVWDVCGNAIIDTLLASNGGVIEYMTRDPEGEVVFSGERFSCKHMEVDEWPTRLSL